MAWFTFGSEHYNTAVIWSFVWTDGWIEITLISGGKAHLFDPDKRLYEKICDLIRVRAR